MTIEVAMIGLAGLRRCANEMPGDQGGPRAEMRELFTPRTAGAGSGRLRRADTDE